ncbi:MAG: sugar ABC transporter permease [Hyphomicrobiales bacterium]|nr:sugar ABC transporter permease [Hyphomicrobiales bacterium]MDE2114852.1 sugar ABC transporter permease [Hyphomicrobiales bacterium]
MTAQAEIKPGESSVSTLDFLKSNLREYGILLALFAIMAFFQFTTHGTLLRPLNLTNLVLQNSYIVIMALGMLLVIVAGHIDLSVGSIVGFIGAFAAVLIVHWHVNFVLTFFICLVLGATIGAVQGSLVAFFRIPAFIVTLGGMLVFRGLSLALLDGQSVGPFPAAFQKLSSGFIPDFFNGNGFHITSMVLGGLVSLGLVYSSFSARREHQKYGFDTEPTMAFATKNLLIVAMIMYMTYLLSTYRGYPNVLLIMTALILIYAFVTTKTTIGRRIYALGGNAKAAKLSGIKTERLTFYTFVNMGVLAALAGMIVAARLNSSTPNAGTSFELDVIAACFIGGASASGGVGKILGAVIGAFVMGVMNNGMSIMGLGIDWQMVIKGLVLLSAVFFDVYNKNKS